MKRGADGALDDLSAAHHETRHRLERVERRMQIDTVMRWLAHHPVPESALVSVVTPTRDRAHCLPDAVASVVAQSYGRWELLIVDDGSTDGTTDYLEELRVSEPRVRVRHADGVGTCRARNLALDAAEGEVVVYLDDDNRFDEHWLRAVVTAFTDRPSTRWLYGARVIDDLRKIVDDRPGGFPEVEFEPFDRERLADGAMFDLGVMAHRLDAGVRFNPDIVRFGDWDLALQLAAIDAPLELPAIAVYYSTSEPDRLSGPRNAYFLDEAKDEADGIRRRYRGDRAAH